MKNTLAHFYFFRALGLTWLYVPFQWFYLRDQGLSATELMGLNTIFCLAAVFLEVPTGAMADRLGRRNIMAIGAVFSSLSCFVFLYFSYSLIWLALANIFAALAMTCISGADSAYLYDFLSSQGKANKYQRAESLSSAVRLGAASVGGIFGASIVARGLDLSMLYVVTALLTLSAAFLAITLPEPSISAQRSGLLGHGKRALGVVLKRRELLGLLVLSAVLFPVLRIGLFLDQPFVRHLGFETASLGLVFAIKDIAAALAAGLTAYFISRIGEFKLLVAIPLIVAGALSAMVWANGPFSVFLVLLPMIAFGVYSPLVRVYVNRRITRSQDRATVLSIEGMARRVGFAVFSPIIGAVFDLWSLKMALAISALWAIFAAVVVFILPLRPRREGQLSVLQPFYGGSKKIGWSAGGSDRLLLGFVVVFFFLSFGLLGTVFFTGV